MKATRPAPIRLPFIPTSIRHDCWWLADPASLHCNAAIMHFPPRPGRQGPGHSIRERHA
jgi:hypothetical protein